MYPNDDDISISSLRLLDLQTGEIVDGRADELLDVVFARPATAERTAERFSDDGVPQRRVGRAPLGKSAISDRTREKMRFTVYADMVKVGQFDGALEGSEEPASEGLKSGAGAARGAVGGFSRRSRSRMMQECAKLRNVSDGFFVTLTFPDIVVSAFDGVEVMAHYAKEMLANLRKRMARKFDLLGGVWRMELMDRKSGDFEGLLVPHFHLMVFRVYELQLPEFQAWVRAAWAEIVGVKEADFLEHGTDVWKINNRRHAMAYASKYAAKIEGDSVAAGRRWGTFGRLDQSPSLEGEMTMVQLVQFKRYERALLRSRGRGGRRYAAALARLPAEYGGYMLGLGDASAAAGWHGNAPTIIRMLRAVGVEIDGS